MLPIERVFHCLQGKPTDRVPYAPLATLYGARLISCHLNEYYANPQKYLKGQIAVVDKLEPDILFTPFALVMEAEAFGSKAVYFEKNPPNLKIPAIVSLADIDNLSVPELENHPRLVYLLESTKLLVEQYKNQIPIAAIVSSPTDLPALIMGIENWIDTLLFHPEETRQMLELTSSFFVKFSNTLLSIGASFILTPASFSNTTIITQQIAKNVLIPELRNQYAKINGPIVFHHGGERLLPFLEFFHNLPNVVSFVLDPRDSFDEARMIIGNNIAIMGNINGPLLLKANPKTIEGWVLKLLENRKNDSKYIMTTSNADIPYDTPLKNLNIITETIRKYE